MSETNKGPDINELVELTGLIARGNELPDDRISISYALVVFQLGASEETFSMLEKSAGWTRDEYDRAVRLAVFLRTSLGNSALLSAGRQNSAEEQEIQPVNRDVNQVTTDEVATPGAAKKVSPRNPETRAESERRKHAKRLDKAFGADTGMAESWLGGVNPENARRFRIMLRNSVGINRTTALGQLILGIGHGGVGLDLEQAKMIGLGLGYEITQRDSRIYRHDSAEPLVFDQYVDFLDKNGQDVTEFRRKYYNILTKLCAFAERKSKTEQ